MLITSISEEKKPLTNIGVNNTKADIKVYYKNVHHIQCFILRSKCGFPWEGSEISVSMREDKCNSSQD
jgi:hypothetical protein